MKFDVIKIKSIKLKKKLEENIDNFVSTEIEWLPVSKRDIDKKKTKA